MNTATARLTRAQISCHGRRVAKRTANQLRKLEDAYARGSFKGHPEDTLNSIAGTRDHLALARKQADTGEPIDFARDIALDEWLLREFNRELTVGNFRGTEAELQAKIAAVETRIEQMRKGLV